MPHSSATMDMSKYPIHDEISTALEVYKRGEEIVLDEESREGVLSVKRRDIASEWVHMETREGKSPVGRCI